MTCFSFVSSWFSRTSVFYLVFIIIWIVRHNFNISLHFTFKHSVNRYFCKYLLISSKLAVGKFLYFFFHNKKWNYLKKRLHLKYFVRVKVIFTLHEKEKTTRNWINLFYNGVSWLPSNFLSIFFVLFTPSNKSNYY